MNLVSEVRASLWHVPVSTTGTVHAEDAFYYSSRMVELEGGLEPPDLIEQLLEVALQ